jgi:hypothetical protein
MHTTWKIKDILRKYSRQGDMRDDPEKDKVQQARKHGRRLGKDKIQLVRKHGRRPKEDEIQWASRHGKRPRGK